MGTKVQSKSYLPGYYSMRDLNKDTDNSWPFCYEDRTLSGKFHSGFTLRPSNGYAAYDKEVLKQTMLRHEEIFRKQVCELHRLYRIQRYLMDELKRKEEHNFCVQVHSLGSSPFSIGKLKGEISWQGDGFSSANASCSRMSVSGIDDAEAHLKFLNDSSSQARLGPRENEGSQGVNAMIDSNIRKFPRRTLDLQLPADAYIETEDAEQAKERNFIEPLLESAPSSNKNFGFLHEDDAKLTLVTAQNHDCRNKTQNSESLVQKGLHPHNLVDLNEPLREMGWEEGVVSSCNSAVRMTHCEGLQEHQNPMRSASEFRGFQKNLFQDRYTSECRSVVPDVDRGENRGDRPPFKHEIGQSSSHVNYVTLDLSDASVRPSSEHVEIKTENGQDFPSVLSLKENKTELQFRDKPSQSSEPSDNSCIANATYLGSTIPTMSGLLSALHHTDNASGASSPFSNSISHTPLAVQALACFSESTMNIQSRCSSTSSQNLGNASDKWQCNHGPRSTLSNGGEARFYPNGFHHRFRSESTASSNVYLSSVTFDKPNLNNGASSAYEKLEDRGLLKCLKVFHGTDVKTANDMNLNLAPPDGFQIEYVLEQKRLGDARREKESIPGSLSRLRTNSSCSEHLNIDNGTCQEELGIEQRPSPLMLNYPTIQEIDEKKEMKDIHLLDVPPLILKAKGTVTRQEASVTSNVKRILGFPVPQRTQYSLADNVKNRVKEKFLHTYTSFDSKLLDLEKQIHTEPDQEKSSVKCPNGYRNHFNFNSSATGMDVLKSSECSPKNKVQLTSAPSARDATPRFASEIDLEAPITSLAEEQIPSPASALDVNHLTSLVEQESKRAIIQATGIEDETIVRMAAEAIHTMSLDKCVHLEDIVVCPPPPASVDNLHWFANVVTSNSDDLENVLEESEGEGSSDIDGMDYFEYMTLNLKEVEVDKYCSRPLEIENPKEEETSAAHLLLTKPRRGQARRRRQRRDFQKDILPGLASLSRHEVSEDLQIIEGLMRASGQSWQAGGSRRNNGRNRNSRTRGRGWSRGGWSRATSVAASVEETPLDPNPRQPGNAEVIIDGGSILGWGRTTRRCWRQRCSLGNILVPPPT